MSLIEAQMCSKPVVAANVGGVRDTFIDEVSGFLINQYNPQAYVNKLKILIENKDLRNCMGEKGYAFAKEKFSKHSEVEAFRKMYKDCISSKEYV